MLLQALLRLSAIAALVEALPGKSATKPDDCQEIRIPITVEVPRFLISTSINNDWDAAALTFNLTRRDFGQASFPLPISGTSAPVKSTYEVGATLCGTGATTLILTHGILESKLYWQPDFIDSDKYNFIKSAVEAGYSVLSYDRIGVAVLEALVAHVRSNNTTTTSALPRKVVLVGHSYGAYISVAAAASNQSRNAVDAVVLTGFAGGFSHFAPFLAGAGLRVARDRQLDRWGALDSGYLTTADLYSDAYIYYHDGDYERRIAEWTHTRGSEPFAVGELPSLLATNITYGAVQAPVQLVQGLYDVSACGGNCTGQVQEFRGNLTGALAVETVEDLPAGHNLNLHLVAPKAFGMMFDFLKRQGL
ncbi:alpha/beta-hydrolase [Apiospora saccharicola]